MLRLMKYEALKKAKLIVIALVMFGLIELAILFTIYKGGIALVFTVILIFLLGFGGLIFLLIDSINMYSSDLYKKPGYMLFLTPTNSYQIIGSKLLISMLEATIGLAMYIGFMALNYNIVYNKYLNDPGSNARMIMDFFESFSALPSPGEIVLGIVSFVIGWFAFILTIYLAITIRKTLLSNVKLGGFFSFIFFLILQTIITYVQYKIVGNVDNGITVGKNMTMNYTTTSLIYSSVVSVIMYVSSSTLLSKGVDL
ncbi:hypothetical protein [Vallitalea guaymasensis]|uniref:Uncharacterized protein n=1 Tax=Vallitalea guaymasensis TaxID=1185412 RepID=A0A8J8M9L7_9FIRM|nr:hypothetical protein [Vallitalea guaymasensis]QUH28872.1 hypothetical protein HYG85_08050 [Vallitalea guaymasensis]